MDPEQLRQAEEDETLHTWGLTQLLLQRSREVVSEIPRKALERAELAVVISRHLSSAYDPAWVLDLRARAYAHLGNARRVVGELLSAEVLLPQGGVLPGAEPDRQRLDGGRGPGHERLPQNGPEEV